MSLFAECPPPPSHYHHITADWKSIAKSPVCNDTPVTHVSSSQAPLDIDSRQAVKLLKVALTGVCSIVVEALNSSHQKDDSVLRHVMESFEKISEILLVCRSHEANANLIRNRCTLLNELALVIEKLKTVLTMT